MQQSRPKPEQKETPYEIVSRNHSFFNHIQREVAASTSFRSDKISNLVTEYAVGPQAYSNLSLLILAVNNWDITKKRFPTDESGWSVSTFLYELFNSGTYKDIECFVSSISQLHFDHLLEIKGRMIFDNILANKVTSPQDIFVLLMTTQSRVVPEMLAICLYRILKEATRHMDQDQVTTLGNWLIQNVKREAWKSISDQMESIVVISQSNGIQLSFLQAMESGGQADNYLTFIKHETTQVKMITQRGWRQRDDSDDEQEEISVRCSNHTENLKYLLENLFQYNRGYGLEKYFKMLILDPINFNYMAQILEDGNDAQGMREFNSIFKDLSRTCRVLDDELEKAIRTILKRHFCHEKSSEKQKSYLPAPLLLEDSYLNENQTPAARSPRA